MRLHSSAGVCTVILGDESWPLMLTVLDLIRLRRVSGQFTCNLLTDNFSSLSVGCDQHSGLLASEVITSAALEMCCNLLLCFSIQAARGHTTFVLHWFHTTSKKYSYCSCKMIRGDNVFGYSSADNQCNKWDRGWNICVRVRVVENLQKEQKNECDKSKRRCSPVRYN